MSVLERAQGPACPRCGCQDADVRAAPPAAPVVSKSQQHYGMASWFAAGRARCRHCGLLFSFRELPGNDTTDQESGDRSQESEEAQPLNAHHAPAPATVSPETKSLRYPVRQCPHCQSTKIRVTTTRRPLRHHKCDGCKKTFKSVERSD